jgi:hypothetical protein
MVEFVAGSDKTYFGLHVNWPIFSSDSNNVCRITTDFYEGPQYKITLNLSSGSREDTC